MQALPSEWSALALVLLLGMKHGFDADHLATIDALTRQNARNGRRFAPYCGALFSIGHGLVVMAVAAGVALASSRWEAPLWLALSGAWISIGVLTLLGLMNIVAVLRARAHEVVRPLGLRGTFLGPVLSPLAGAHHPLAIMGVGSLFALSLDTVSLSALFTLTARDTGGLPSALALGALFMLGMLITDAINGLWIARLINRADALGRLASRVMGLTVGGVSLMVALLGVARLSSAEFAAWADQHDLSFGVLVVVVLALSFLIAVHLAEVAGRVRPESASPQQEQRGASAPAR